MTLVFIAVAILAFFVLWGVFKKMVKLAIFMALLAVAGGVGGYLYFAGVPEGLQERVEQEAAKAVKKVEQEAAKAVKKAKEEAKKATEVVGEKVKDSVKDALDKDKKSADSAEPPTEEAAETPSEAPESSE